jgi:hypothetical protein
MEEMSGEYPKGYGDHFVEGLVKRFPELSDVLDQHQQDHGELLPHFFMSDLVRHLRALYLQPQKHDKNLAHIRDVIGYLSEQFDIAPPLVVEVIAASFLENLPYRHESAAELVDLLPPNLRKALALQRDL